MPAEQGKDAERFAAAVEQGRPPGSVADDELARDLEIVAMLRSQGAAYAPRPDEKARAKQRLMAMLGEQSSPPRPAPPSAQELTAPLARVPSSATADDEAATTVMPVVTTEMPAEAPAESSSPAPDETTVAPAVRPGRRAGRHTLPNRPPSRARGSKRPASHGLARRALLVGAAALAVLVAVAGTGVFASRNALPGDSLYALKRAAESAGTALTFDDATKAQRHLDLAATRLDEIERMVKSDPSASTALDPQLLESAIQDFDTATGEGSRMMLASDDTGGVGRFGALQAWAAQQVARLTALRSALPAAAVPGADDSISLLDRLRDRAEALNSRSDCSEVTSGTVDDLGPLPAQGACTPVPDKQRASGTNPQNPRTNPGARSNVPGATPGASDPATSTETTPPTDGENPGLLPGLNGGNPPDLLPGDQGGPNSDQGSSSESPTPAPPGDGNVSVPLPLLPSVNLPPLLPGLPGITIGGG